MKHNSKSCKKCANFNKKSCKKCAKFDKKWCKKCAICDGMFILAIKEGAKDFEVALSWLIRILKCNPIKTTFKID
jgi:hypothetical protein